MPEHAHEDAHLILAVDPGYITRALPADEVGSGFDVVYNPPGTVHRDCFTGPAGRFISVAVGGGMAAPGGLPRLIRTPDARRLARQLLAHCLSSSPDVLEMESTLIDLLSGADRGQTGSEPAWVGDADELIEACAADPNLTVASIAAALRIHPVYLARAYRRSRGESPSTAIQRRRLESAIAMIGRTRSLSQVAATCGYADQSHFCRSMRKYLGISPSVMARSFG